MLRSVIAPFRNDLGDDLVREELGIEFPGLVTGTRSTIALLSRLDGIRTTLACSLVFGSNVDGVSYRSRNAAVLQTETKPK